MVEERALLPELRERIRRIERPAETTHGTSPFGIAAVDRVLPGGGLARGALHEILGAGGDEEDGALAAAFISHILGRLINSPTSPSHPHPPLPRMRGRVREGVGPSPGSSPGQALFPLKGGEGLPPVNLPPDGGPCGPFRGSRGRRFDRPARPLQDAPPIPYAGDPKCPRRRPLAAMPRFPMTR
jgi:hypothetical protein